MSRRPAGGRLLPTAAVLLTVLVVALLFWPTHVPLGGGPLALTIDITGNIAVFALVAGLGALVSERPVVVLVGATLLSCSAELAQATLLPDRYPSLLDIAANVAGAALGVVLGARLRRRRTTRRG